MFAEKDIQKQMRLLHITRDEAIQVLQDDLDIDKGLPKEWDLTPEQLKNQRKLCNVATRKSSPKTRTRKDNPIKQSLIQFVFTSLQDCDVASEIVISNSERVIDFVGSDGVKYSLTLTAHRK